MRGLALALLCVALPPAVASAEPEETVVVSYIQGMPEFEGGIDVMAEAYRRIGVAATFRPFPAAEALEASRSGEADAELNRIAGIDRNFPELVQIPIPVNSMEGAVFARELRFPVQSWKSLKPYRVGIVRGILFAEEGTVGMDVQAARDEDELVGWIAEGKVDVGVMLRGSGRAAVRRSGHGDIRELDGLLETLLLYHYVNARRAGLAERLEPVLKEMLLEGTTRRLLDARRAGAAPGGS